MVLSWVHFTAPDSTAPLCPAVKFKILLSVLGNLGADHCKVRKTKFLVPSKREKRGRGKGKMPGISYISCLAAIAQIGP